MPIILPSPALPTTVTANTLIRDAMIGINAIGTTETPGADEAQLALRHLNRMLDAWRAKNLFAYAVSEQVVALTSAMQTRTIGSGGQIDVTRPVRVETGSFVRFGGVDLPLRIASRDQWGAISLKTLAGAPPEWVYYEAASPLGTLHFFPQADCEAHLMLQSQLAAFVDLSTPYTLPPGYEDALELSLEERLCRPFSRPVPAELKQLASAARAVIKAANYQIPELDMPVGRSRFGDPAAFLAGV